MRKRWVPSMVAAMLATAGCGGDGAAGDEPPYEALPIRDALQADAAAIAAMDPAARRELAARLVEAEAETEPATEAEPEVAREPGKLGATTREALLELDARREARGADALVVASLERAERADRAAPSKAAGDSDRAGAPLTARARRLEGFDPDSPTFETEARALDGRAGRVVLELAGGASRGPVVRRVEGWPVGALAVNDVVYVNAAWLVAMSELEREPEREPEGEDAVPNIAPPGPNDAFRRERAWNPYAPPRSLAECASEVTAECQACLDGQGCEASDLVDLPDPKAACAFLLDDASRPERLCAHLILAIDSVAECTAEGSSGCSLDADAVTSGDLAAAEAFLPNGECRAAIDACLADAHDGSGFDGGGSSGASACTVAPRDPSPGRGALLLIAPVIFVFVAARRRREASWKRS